MGCQPGRIQTFITTTGHSTPIDRAAELAELLGSLTDDEAANVTRLLQATDLIIRQPQ